jgi:hypothetical protein
MSEPSGVSATSTTKLRGKGNGFEDMGSVRKFLDDMNFLNDSDELRDTNITFILRQIV